jgi:hypothetical protein
VVDKPPSTAAVPPHRIRLEAAAMESSLDTFSTQDGVPIRRLPFVDVVDVSGDDRMSIGAGSSRQLGVWATPSRRCRSTIFSAPYASYPQIDYH